MLHAEELLFDLDHVFRKSIFAKAEVRFGEYTRVALEGVYNFETRDWLVRPRLDWSILDGLELVGIVDLMGGPDASFFGPFRDNKRVQLRLKYSFSLPIG